MIKSMAEDKSAEEATRERLRREGYTEAELRVLSFVARAEGWEYAIRHAHRILFEAEMIGEL
jgi:hypothetical protein